MEIARVGGCSPGDVWVRPIRFGPERMGTAWAKCPLAATAVLTKVAEIRIGWLCARVELLAERPLQCYKCMELGHVRQHCPSATKWGEKCFRCGTPGHQAVECSSSPRCPICKNQGEPARHCVGPAYRAGPKGGRALVRGSETPVIVRTAGSPIVMAAAAEKALLAAVIVPTEAAVIVPTEVAATTTEERGKESPLPRREKRGEKTVAPPAEDVITAEAMEFSAGSAEEVGVGGAKSDKPR